MLVAMQLAELRRDVTELVSQSAENRAIARDVGVVALVALAAAGFLVWDRIRQARSPAGVPATRGTGRMRDAGEPAWETTASLDEVTAELARLSAAVDRIATEVAKVAPRPH